MNRYVWLGAVLALALVALGCFNNDSSTNVSKRPTIPAGEISPAVDDAATGDHAFCDSAGTMHDGMEDHHAGGDMGEHHSGGDMGQHHSGCGMGDMGDHHSGGGTGDMGDHHSGDGAGDMGDMGNHHDH